HDPIFHDLRRTGCETSDLRGWTRPWPCGPAVIRRRAHSGVTTSLVTVRASARGRRGLPSGPVRAAGHWRVLELATLDNGEPKAEDEAMDFGIFNLMGSRDPDKPTAQVFGEVAEQTRLADALGYSIAWFAEHHFSNYCLCASPLMMVAHCASITKR